MFVGFIAVVVILLVIVGLMSTGATNGSGGVDQTKATKAISEISALAQSTGFYKTTVDTTNFAGLTVQKLEDAGIVATADVEAALAAADLTKEATGTIIDNDRLVKSKAVPGLYYKIAESAKGPNYFDIELANKTGDLTDSLEKALDQSYGKLVADLDNDGTDDATNTATDDGAAIITFN